MAKCIELSEEALGEIVKVLKVDVNNNNAKISTEEQAKKPYKFDTHDIEPDMYFDLFFGEKTKKETGFKRISNVINNNNAIKRLFGATKNVSEENPLFADLFIADATTEQKSEAGRRMQIRGLAVKHIIGTIKSDSDVQKNLHIPLKEAEKLLYDGGSRKVATIGMATALGRDIAYSMGFKMSMSPDYANRIYNKIGTNALLEVQEKTGLITIDENDYIINNKFMDDPYSQHEPEKKIIKGFSTVRINYDKLAKATKTKTQEEWEVVLNSALEEGKSLELMARDNKALKNAGLVDGAARYVQRMSVPSNLATPTATFNNSTTGNNITMSAENQTLLNNMQKIPGEVNPRVGQYFLYLNQVTEEAKKNSLVNDVDYDFETIIKKTVGDDPELLTFIFGTFDTTSSVDTKNKAVGQSLSKTSTVQNLIEDAGRYFNADGSAKSIFFEHEMYRTGRVGYVQSVFNPQTDKFFSRFVLDGGEYTIDVGGKEYIQLINGINDDSGISVEEIIGDDENIGLDHLLSQYNETFKSGLTGKAALDAQNSFYTTLKTGKFWDKGELYKTPKLKGSLWQMLHAIEGINDVRLGTNNKITTRFQTKPDATGSGIVLQLLQMFGLDGSHEGALDNLKRLGLVVGAEGDISDVYGFLQNAIQDSMTKLVKPGPNGEMNYSQVGEMDMTNPDYENDVKSNIFIQRMINLKIAGDLRDIAKPATMITSYLAGPATVKAETGEAYAQAMFDILEGKNPSKAQIDFIKTVLKDANPELYAQMEKNSFNGRIGRAALKSTKGVKSALEDHIAATVGQHMYTLIGRSLTSGSMQNFQDKIIDLYKSMQAISKREFELTGNPLMMKTLPAQIVMDIADWEAGAPDFKNSKSFLNKDGSKMSKKQLIEKYGMMITSPSQVLEDVMNEDTLVMREGMNALTSLVNVVHSMDSAIMFRAHRKTRAKLGMPAGEGSFTVSIHDANNADAAYNAVFQDMYREALIEVVGSYDMYSQMLSAYEVMLDQKSPENTADMSKTDFRKATKLAENSVAIKKQFIEDGKLDLKSDKTFGYKDELDIKPKKKPDPVKPKPKKPEPKVETKEEIKTAKEQVINILSKTKNEILIKFSKLPNISEIIKDGTKWEYTPNDNTIEVNLEPYEDLTLEETLAHEVVHFSTLAYLTDKGKKTNPAVQYVIKTVQKLSEDEKMSAISNLLASKKSDEFAIALDRFNYVMTRPTETEKIAEFVAVMTAEPMTAQIIYQAIESVESNKLSTTLRGMINRMVNGVYNYIEIFVATKRNVKDLNDGKNIDVIILGNSIKSINAKGEEFNIKEPVRSKKARDEYNGSLGVAVSPQRKAFMKKLKYKAYEPQDAYKDKIPYIEDVAPMINQMISSRIGSVVMDADHVFRGQKQLEAADKFLTENFPIYAANREMLLNYADSPAIQRMKGYLDAARFGDRLAMEQLISAQDKATQERGSIDNVLISNMKKLMNKMSPEQVALIYNITSQTPMFSLDRTNLMNDLVSGKKDINKELARLEKMLKPAIRTKAKRMADMLTGEKGHVLDLHDAYNSDTAGVGENVQEIFEQVVALRTILNTKKAKEGFALLNENRELYALIIDASTGLKEKSDLLYQKKHENRQGKERYTDARRYRENLIADIFEEEYDIEAVTSQEFSEGLYSNDNGWLMLRKPEGKEYGIMYRKSKDETYQQGAGTTISYRHSDVIVPKSKQMANPRNVLSTDIGQNEKRHKMVLTKAEKDKLGLIRNPADAIYRSYSRLVEIEETQQARDLILSYEFTDRVKTKKDLAKLDKELGEMKPEDRKWLLGLPEGVRKSDIVNKNAKGKYDYPNIQKYYKIPERSSSVGNFRHNFDLVRIDAEPWLTGYKDAILFENHPGARKVAYVVRQAVKWTKITWTALSPTKILNDAISNSLVLLGYDVPPKKIFKYGNEINKQIGEFEKLRMAELDARIHGKDDVAKRISKEIENHPMAMMMYNGMMQSINIELFQRDQSVVTGIQKDIEKLLNDHLLIPGGEKSSLYNGIKYLQEYGDWGIESILEFASKGAKQVEALEALGDQLESSSKKLKGLKNNEKEETMAKFVSEFLMTPSSEAVQFGSNLVQRADIIARGILVKHMMDEGASEKDAVIAATDAFINYKQNMPKELKILSDYGVLLFPSFWMRIQKVIWSLLKRNPATAVAALSMEEIIMLNVPTIFDANIFSKFDHGIWGLPPVMGFWQ